MSRPWPGRLVVRPLTPGDAAEIAGWRYDGPYAVYDARPDDAPVCAEGGYLAVAGADGGPLVGFCCVGAQARVPGLDEEPGVVDLGVGMAPAYVGAGNGALFGRAVLEHLRATTDARRFRAVVQSWNERSLRLTRRLGFVEVGRHTAMQGGRPVAYTVLVTG